MEYGGSFGEGGHLIFFKRSKDVYFMVPFRFLY
jgi:hypothetical protein